MFRSLFRRLMSFRPGRYVAGFDRSSVRDYSMRADFEIVGERVELRSISRVSCEPGDVVVFSCERRLSLDELRQFSDNFSDLFPGCRGLLLDPGVRVELMAKPRRPLNPQDFVPRPRPDFYVDSAGVCFPGNDRHR